ncbi:MAG: preprotein translocase subunit SecE [Clostridiales bacterium]|nr:preprotein translocase subunit SecE [Clostridiales bacterium]
MAGDKDKKDKNRARLAERRRVTMPESKKEGKDGKEKTRSALVRNVQGQRNAQAAKVKAAPKNPTPQAANQKNSGGLMDYFRGVRTETKKVVWPTRKELVSYTVVVFIACLFFGLFLWGVDSGFLAIIQHVFNISMVS